MKKTLLLLIALALTFGAFVFTSCDENGGASAHTLYEIDATFDEENLTVSASERVTYINKTEAELGALYFHLYPSAFRKDARYAPVGEREKAEAYPIGVDYGGITLSSVTVNGEACEWSIGGEDEDILMITSLTLVPGDKTVVDIDFTLDIPQARHRFGCFDGKLNLGNWYPIACVYENGAFRTDPYYSNGDPFYSEIADYKVSFTAPTGWNVAGTGSVKAEINGDLSTTTFTANGVRDFALTASEKYTSIEKTTADGVTVRYYYFSDNSANEHLDLCARAVETFSDLFGEYAYDTLSVAQTPFVHGGMEYPQMVFVSDSLTGDLYDEAIIHEIAHQWWYASVGNDQINSAWMDEGLTEYSVTLFYENNPDYGVEASDRIADAMQSYVLFNEVYKDKINGDTSMNRPLCNYFSFTDYAYHNYVKGELLFDSLRHAVGDENFYKSLRAYYSDYSGKIATESDLISAFENTCDMSLKKFFENWTTGKVGLY